MAVGLSFAVAAQDMSSGSLAAAMALALGMALRPARKDKLLKVQRYMGMGLTIKEICLLLGLRKSAAYGLMHQARELGLLEGRLPARPVQGNLLALDDKGMDA